MNDKAYVVITGATSGIGRATAIQLAKKGYSLIILGRNHDKFLDLQKEILSNSPSQSLYLAFIECDLGSLNSVRTAAVQINELNIPISILINNAGSYYWNRTVTVDGYEATFAVCYLSHFLLTNLILEQIKEGIPSRIINLASNIHKYFDINLDDLMIERKYRSQKAYAASKTAMVLFTHALARRLDGTKVSVHSVHPGHVKTNMTTKNAPAVMRFFMNFIPGHVSIDKASENVVNVATRSEFIDKTGLYVVRSAISKAKKTTYDFNLQEKIWKKSNELVNENFP